MTRKGEAYRLRAALEEIVRVCRTNQIPDRHGRMIGSCVQTCLDECEMLALIALKDAGALREPSATGSRGGLARAAALSPERRQEIARNAAKARWRTHG